MDEFGQLLGVLPLGTSYRWPLHDIEPVTTTTVVKTDPTDSDDFEKPRWIALLSPELVYLSYPYSRENPTSSGNPTAPEP